MYHYRLKVGRDRLRAESPGVPRAHEAFDDHGHLKDKGQQAMLKTVIEKLGRAARVLNG